MKISIINLFLVFMSSHLLVSCSMGSSSKSLPPTKAPTKTINQIDGTAIIYKTKYGVDYEIDGNVIARYPHFDLSLFSQEIIYNSANDNSTYTYELTTKDGLRKTHITCDPRSPEKKHFFLEGLHFFYHSNSDGSINIYMPPQLLAKR